jgi:hypothetical protein
MKGGVKKNKGFYERWKMEVCILKDMIGCCTKQQVRISKVTLTSILGKRYTCETSSYMASLMKDHVKVKVPNGTFKT